MGFRITISAPGTVDKGSWFAVSGIVYDEVTGIPPHPGAEVVIYYDSKTLGVTGTGVDGDYLKECRIGEAGTFTLKATCLGATATRSIKVEEPYVPPPPPPEKISTSITISVGPTSGAPPLNVGISGRITRNDTGAGISVQIDLYRNGALVGSQVSNSYGYYTFADILTVSGSYGYHTEFAGDMTFKGCEANPGAAPWESEAGW